uniref:Metastasis associated 1 family, member 2 n=1 Tax=Gadus morhua TaxID=8049 RepID=A0A8C5B9G0_GADMO
MAQVYSFPFDTWNRLMGPFVETNGTTLVPGFGPSHHHTVGCDGPSLVGENKTSPMILCTYPSLSLSDYVYFENSSSNPYLIRRIEELNKTANGNVEAKVVCLFRRRDISGNLNTLADSNARDFEEESKQPSVSEQQKHQLKHRELFLSRQFESLPATHIRGKCNVTLLNETDVLAGYLEKEDCFFYSLVFDPVQKTLLADQGEIRVGSKFQAEIPDKLAEIELDTRIQDKLETKVWDPDNQLKDPQIDQFLVVARAVGTFARALDCSSSIRQPSLHMSAAAASRDITLFHAMDTLQKNEYDLARSMSTLVPQGGPVLCRDEMEEWSASEAMLFEEALEKYGKDFNDIRQDFLPWKSLASVVQFYYMWKTTDRYIQQKRLKAAEADSKLKQVYIPTYTKPNPNQIMAPGSKPGMNGAPAGFQKGLSCESCHTAQSPQWYAWGPPNMQCRLCASCWIYWKKYGGLKTPTQLEGAARESGGPRGHMTRQEAQGLSPFTRNEGRAKLLAKNRQTFILQTTKLTRIARRVCMDILQPRRAARRPYASINANAVKAECIIRLPKATKNPQKNRVIPRQSLATIVKDLAITAPLKLKAPRGLPPPINRNQTSQPRGGPGLLGKRPFDNVSGGGGGGGGVPFPTNGRPFTSGLRTTSQSVIKRQKVNQGDAPNPVVFVATKDTRALRKHLTQSEMRRAARKPHLPVRIKLPPPPPPPRAPPMPLLPSSTSEPIILED